MAVVAALLENEKVLLSRSMALPCSQIIALNTSMATLSRTGTLHAKPFLLPSGEKFLAE
jgi:hypothetical protein